MNLSGIDIVFLILALFLIIRCTFRGFVTEVMSMAALILGIFGAIVFSGRVSVIVENYLGDTIWNNIIAFLAVFLIIFIVVKIFQSLINKLIEKIHLQKLDRALGFFLGIAESVLVIMVILFILQLQPFFDTTEVLENSVIAGYLNPLIPLATELIRERFRVEDV